MKIAALTDTFDAPLNPSIWRIRDGAYVSNGELVVEVSPTGSTYLGTSNTLYEYDLTDSSLSIELADIPLQVGTEFYFELGVSSTPSGGAYLGPAFVISNCSGTVVNGYVNDNTYYIYFVLNDADSTDDLAYAERFDPAEDRWLRLRYDSSTELIYWETSRDGIVWSVRRTSTDAQQYDPDELAAVLIYTYALDTASSGDYVLRLDNLNLPKLPDPSVQPSYVYKHYKAGLYQGTLTVANELNFTSEINANSAPMTLIIPSDLELTSPIANDNFIVDESADNIVDEKGNSLIYSSAFSIEGVPTLGDTITVTEFSAFYPRGLVIYDGIVISLTTNYADNNIELQCLSKGVRLDNYLVNIQTEQAVVLSGDADGTIGLVLNGNSRIAQTFQVGSTTSVTSIDVNLDSLTAGWRDFSFFIRQGTPLSVGSTLYAGTVRLAEPGSIKFSLTVPVVLAASTSYFFELQSHSSGSIAYISTSTTAGYANGTLYKYTGGSWSSEARDMVFTINEAAGAGVNQFNSYDPGNIAREGLEAFEQTAGTVTHSDSSVSLTNTIVSYTFTFNTYYEFLKKCVELAPANWYFTVDPGSGLVTFDRKGQPVHVLTKGRVSHFDIGLSLEDVINNVYFSGGDTGGGENLLVNDYDVQSIEDYGQWLNLPTDSRVTDQTSGELIAQGLVDEHSQPRLRSAGVEITIADYDISALRLGQVVTFAGYAPFINDAELQIVRVQRYADRVRLALEVLPPDVSKRIEDIRRNLLQQETLDNPDL